MEREVYKTNTIEDTELIYTILREKYPNKQIEIEFNDNTKDYTLKLTDSEFLCDPEVPLNVTIKVIYGDSCTGDTPLLLMKNNQVYIETIQSIFDHTKKVEYPGFKMFDQSIRLEKEYSLTDYKVWNNEGDFTPETFKGTKLMIILKNSSDLNTASLSEHSRTSGSGSVALAEAAA